MIAMFLKHFSQWIQWKKGVNAMNSRKERSECNDLSLHLDEEQFRLNVMVSWVCFVLDITLFIIHGLCTSDNGEKQVGTTVKNSTL